MTEQHLLALYGLKYNPFLPGLPAEALWQAPGTDPFFARLETLLSQGGFALICGEPGLGKSKTLQRLAGHLERLADVAVGVMERPQSGLGDFYRELGELFGVQLSPANRYGGFKALRARWRGHIKSSLWRPILLVDEAQEVSSECLNELRLLGSAHFDSECLLTTVLCGDGRLSDRFRTRELLPLGSRIRTRLVLEALGHDQLLALLDFILEQAGAPQIMTPQLRHTLCEHAAGNPRVLANMGAELLAAGAERELGTLDEDLFFETFAKSLTPRRRQTPPRQAPAMAGRRG